MTQCWLFGANSVISDKHLQLLFTILQNSPDASLRSNIVIAFGDLAFRFPNLVEPWSSHIYDRLKDPDARVRKNTVMVLTHLILNDMIRVKGQISEMAICLEDNEQRIADMAHLFFYELSQKGTRKTTPARANFFCSQGNALYNILPDAIGKLSTNPRVTADTFDSIMKYLFSFIQKVSIVGKQLHTNELLGETIREFGRKALPTIQNLEWWGYVMIK